MRRSTRHRLKQRALYLGVVALCALLAVWLATWGEAADTRYYQAPAAGPTPAPDISNQFLAIWSLEEELTETRVNNSTRCGASCNLTANGSIATDTTNFTEKAASDLFTTTQSLQCDWATTCTALRVPDPFSIGCWARPASPFATRAVMRSHDGSGKYRIRYSGTNTVEFRIDENPATVATSAATVTVGEWYHMVGTYADDADDQQIIYINGANSGSVTRTTGFATPLAGGNGFLVSYLSEQHNGNIDECFIIDRELTPEQVCHLCSCNADNGQGCTCNGTSYVNVGRNSVGSPNCGGCTLPPDCSNPLP